MTSGVTLVKEHPKKSEVLRVFKNTPIQEIAESIIMYVELGLGNSIKLKVSEEKKTIFVCPRVDLMPVSMKPLKTYFMNFVLDALNQTSTRNKRLQSLVEGDKVRGLAICYEEGNPYFLAIIAPGNLADDKLSVAIFRPDNHTLTLDLFEYDHPTQAMELIGDFETITKTKSAVLDSAQTLNYLCK
ncbi:hypothetical protein IT417_03710 [bacterium]|nr:hypothetical protein [bacterium]